MLVISYWPIIDLQALIFSEQPLKLLTIQHKQLVQEHIIDLKHDKPMLLALTESKEFEVNISSMTYIDETKIDTTTRENLDAVFAKFKEVMATATF